ncbi:TlpA family protein disulfide reductase [Sinimarinibacterium thermocellulolyticum]|uniref:TlpA disulfide reductase family protein n=1 Tax=Sinimarinibacterium thermocellulolyticum TaxID=3170016 RepID=A0ABV2AAU0_9GAMM
MRQFLLILVLALCAGSAGYLAYRLLGPGASPLIGRAAPPLVFVDTQQREHRLDALRGHWVLINFWASWCAPCMDELPLLVEAQARFAERGLRVLGPALDDADAVAAIVQRFRINYPVTADFAAADAAMQALGNTRGALPYTVLIDPQGRIAEVVLGGLSRDALETLITEHLGA